MVLIQAEVRRSAILCSKSTEAKGARQPGTKYSCCNVYSSFQQMIDSTHWSWYATGCDPLVKQTYWVCGACRDDSDLKQFCWAKTTRMFGIYWLSGFGYEREVFPFWFHRIFCVLFLFVCFVCLFVCLFVLFCFVLFCLFVCLFCLFGLFVCLFVCLFVGLCLMQMARFVMFDANLWKAGVLFP